MNLERIGRLLLRLAGVLTVAGVAVAATGHQSVRFLALSGCLVMVSLVALLLAPRQAPPAQRYEAASEPRPPRYVPQQRTPVEPPRETAPPQPSDGVRRTAA
ncbi:MAG TPA: hypothetical protein VGD72_06470 [Mycobacteriales bacterium]